MKTKKLVIIGIALILAAIICMALGFDCKLRYYNNESRPEYSVNAYVGGDAYNFIINGTYFTGYMVLACGFGICGTLQLGIAMLIRVFENWRREVRMDIVQEKLECETTEKESRDHDSEPLNDQT